MEHGEERTQFTPLGQRSHRTVYEQYGNDDRGGLGWRTVAGGFRHWMTIGEDFFEGHSWTTGVVLLITVGVGLLSRVYAVYDPHMPTVNVQVTREPEVARQPRGMTFDNMRTKIINQEKEREVGVSFSIGLQVTMTICTNPSSGVTIASTLRPSTKSGPETMAT